LRHLMVIDFLIKHEKVISPRTSLSYIYKYTPLSEKVKGLSEKTSSVSD
jgi:hypothetical protein